MGVFTVKNLFQMLYICYSKLLETKGYGKN